MYYDHSTCMYYDHSTCMYDDHSRCMYHDQSACIMSYKAQFPSPDGREVWGRSPPSKQGRFGGAAGPPPRNLSWDYARNLSWDYACGAGYDRDQLVHLRNCPLGSNVRLSSSDHTRIRFFISKRLPAALPKILEIKARDIVNILESKTFTYQYFGDQDL